MPVRSTLRLTKRSVESLPSFRDSVTFDADLPGFAVRVYANGARSFMVQYRNADGRTRRVALGRFGPVTVEQARREANRILGEVATGADPSGERKARREAPTVAEFADRYLKEHADRFKKPRSAEEDRRNLKLHVIPRLGSMKLEDVSRRDIEKLHRALSLEGTGDDAKPTPARGNRVLALVSKMLSLAESLDLRPVGSNPCRAIKKNPETHRERFLSAEEAARLWEVIDTAEREATILPQVAALFRALLLTGRRLSELLTLEWNDLDFERGAMRLRDSKTGAATYPLSSRAITLFAELPRAEGARYVFPSRNRPVTDAPAVKGKRDEPPPERHLSPPQAAWRRLRAAAGIDDVRLHDLRHSFASNLAGAGESLFVIGRTLGHKQAATTARYAHLADDPVRRAVERAGDLLAAMTSAKPSAEIVPMKKRRNAKG